MSDEHNKSDPKIEPGKVSHTNFDDWFGLPPGTDYYFRGMFIGTVVKVKDRNPYFFLRGTQSSGWFDDILGSFVIPSWGKKGSDLAKILPHSVFLCIDGKTLNSRVNQAKSKLTNAKEDYEKYYSDLREWTAIGNSKKIDGSGALLELHEDVWRLAKGGTFNIIRRKKTGGTSGLASITYEACRAALLQGKIRAYTQGNHHDFSDFTLHHVEKNKNTGLFGFGKRFQIDLRDALRTFGEIGPFFWNSTTVRFEIVYDLITIAYEIDLPGDGSDVTPHTLVDQCDLPLQLPLELQHIIFTFIRKRENVGRRVDHRLRRVTVGIRNNRGDEK